MREGGKVGEGEGRCIGVGDTSVCVKARSCERYGSRGEAHVNAAYEEGARPRGVLRHVNGTQTHMYGYLSCMKPTSQYFMFFLQQLQSHTPTGNTDAVPRISYSNITYKSESSNPLEMRVHSIRTSTRYEYTATPVEGACVYTSSTQCHQQTTMAKLTYTRSVL